MKRLLYLFSVLLFFQGISSPATEKNGFIFAGDIKSFGKFDDHLEFKLDNALFNLYIIDRNIIRFRYTNQDEFSKAPSYSVLHQPAAADFKFADSSGFYEIRTGELTVRISKSPCRISIYDKNFNLINKDEEDFGVSFDNDEVRCFKTLFPDEQFYGLGEKTGGLNKRGNQYTMWNSDKPGYSPTEDPLYQSIPFFIGIREFASNPNEKIARLDSIKTRQAYGIFLDNTFKSYFNMGASNNRFYWFGAEKGEMDYYFIYGPEIKKVISSYTLLTGRIEMPPMWALGYQQSRWSYYPESGVRNLARTFRDKNIPIDVIYLDIHYMDEYRVFTWDKERFPQPQKMLNDLSKEGFKIITIVDPGVKADSSYSAAKEGIDEDLFVKYPDGKFYYGEVWPSWSFFPDFTKKETREWWGEKNGNLLKEGLAGIWNDMNEPAVWGQAFPDIVQFDFEGFGADHKRIHNVYALQMARATFDGIKKMFPERRPFILTRAGFAGIQRYAAVWTGDNLANEDHLKMACTMVQGLGISGVPFVGSDVGGFMGIPTAGLYNRWIQIGAFTPFFRGHSAYGTVPHEPWAFGEDIESWARDIIKLRYMLLPFFYNEFYNASQTGLPVARPMFLNFQDDEECYKWDSQYQFMIGENLLVAPVLSEKENFKKLYLPNGKWIDWWTNKVYEGNQWIIVEVPQWRIPLFIKEGGIIPLQEEQNYVGEKKIEELELRIFASDSSFYLLYEDDGISTNYKDGTYSLSKFEVIKQNDAIEIQVSKERDGYNTGRKNYIFKIFNSSLPGKVSVNNNELKWFEDLKSLMSAGEGFCYLKDEETLVIKAADKKNINISIR
jgi:alpha-glucosidase